MGEKGEKVAARRRWRLRHALCTVFAALIVTSCAALRCELWDSVVAFNVAMRTARVLGLLGSPSSPTCSAPVRVLCFFL